MGEVLSVQGDFAGALMKFKAAQEIFYSLVNTNPKNPYWRIDFSMTYDRIGDILFNQDKPAEALANYRDGLAIAESLAAANPLNEQWQVEVVRFHWVLATRGDDPARRWAVIVTILRKLKLPAEQSGWLLEAESHLAEEAN
jgi:hypothetical protein